MKTTLLTATAVALLMAATPAFSASSTDTTGSGTTQGTGTTGSTTDGSMTGTTGTDATGAIKRDQTADVGQMQAGDWMASKMIGKTVYSTGGENIGDISDFVVDKSGRVSAVVIGVGGFLGLGEKNVAVALDRLNNVDTDGTARLTLDMTKADLENAPEFVAIDQMPSGSTTGSDSGTTQ
ncbi:MAG: PRC-barrel domain-containing protein [Hyphomicrobiaceae bacterium]